MGVVFGPAAGRACGEEILWRWMLQLSRDYHPLCMLGHCCQCGH